MSDAIAREEAGSEGPAKIAIVALGPSSLRYMQQVSAIGDPKALYDEVWTVNSYAEVIRSDRLFHMDDFLVQEKRAEKNPRIKNMLDAIKRYPGPVYTCRPLPRYPSSIEYPLASVISHYAACYFNNTVPYMAAFAGLLPTVREVTLFGCDYSWPDKTTAEQGRACLEYWLGRLNAQGISTMVCEESTLMDARDYRNGKFPIYGYCDAHDVSISPVGPNQLRLVIAPKEELPTAEEMEKKYDHGEDHSPTVLEFVEGTGPV